MVRARVGVAARVGSVWTAAGRWIAERFPRPDTSRAGFNAAVDAAIAFAGEWDWHSIDELQAELVEHICDRLRAGRIDMRFIGRRKDGGRELRFFVETPWGWQARIVVPATFIQRKG